MVTAAKRAVAPSPPLAAWPRRLLIFIGPDLAILSLFSMVLIGMTLAYGARVRLRDGSILLSLGTLLLFLLIGRLSQRTRGTRFSAGRIVRDWMPFSLLVLVYENLREYTGLMRKEPIDAWLLQADVRLFGIEPTVWIQRFASPLFTDYMAFAYSLYFILPLALCIALYARGRRSDFQLLTLSIIVTMYLGFLLYLVFPAGPPRFYRPLLHEFSPPRLPSYFFFNYSQRAWDDANPMRVYASFPSLHCALSMATLLHVVRVRDLFGRYRRIFVALYGVMCSSLWLATVYLRHHWVVDILAGWALAGLSLPTAQVLSRAWSRLAQPLPREKAKLSAAA
jgi:membrane-associated phospholipid phosphatase